MVLEVTKDNFDQEVMQETEKVVLIDFWGPSCAPCMALMPHVEKLSETYSEKLKVVKINIQGSRLLAIKHQVLGLPTFIFLKNGQEIKRLTSNITAQSLEKEIQDILQNN